MSNRGCGAAFAEGQWYGNCGSMAQGDESPALCTCCGGEYIRADEPDAEEKLRVTKERWAKEWAVAKRNNAISDWNFPVRWDITPMNVTPSDSWEPRFFMNKPPQTPIDAIERTLRKAINPHSDDIHLTEEQLTWLQNAIRQAAERLGATK